MESGWRPNKDQRQLDRTVEEQADTTTATMVMTNGKSNNQTLISTTAPTLSPSSSSSLASFHRFNIPLVPLASEFSCARLQLSHIVTYHHSLIQTAQAAQSMLKSSTPGMVGNPAQQMQSMARAYLMHLKQRLELQRQHRRMRVSCQTIYDSIHDELEHRKRASIRIAPHQPIRSPDGHYALPSCDLHALASSLAFIRAELELTNGAEDSTAGHTFQPVGTFTVSNQTTIDGQALGARSLIDMNHPILTSIQATQIHENGFAWEKHNINLSSTGATTCFVLDLNLLRPILANDGDHRRLDSLITSTLSHLTSLGATLAALHPLSGLGQLLSNGFCAFGTLTIMLSEDSVVEQSIDEELLAAVAACNWSSVREKIALLLTYEQIRETAPAGQQLQVHREKIVDFFQQLAAEARPPPSTTAANAFIHTGYRYLSKVEGPSIIFGATGLSTGLTSHPSRDPLSYSLSHGEEYSLTFVGVEKVERIAAAGQQSNLMTDEVTGAGDSFYAYRFILSHPLAMHLARAQQLFHNDFYSDLPPPQPASLDSTSLQADTYHTVCLSAPLRLLLDGDGSRRVHTSHVFGSHLRFRVGEPFTRSVRLTSVLMKDIAGLKEFIQTLRQEYILQRLYRTCFEVNEATIPSTVPSNPKHTVKMTNSFTQAPHSLVQSTTKSGSTKLKFSYRDLLDDVILDNPPSSLTSSFPPNGARAGVVNNSYAVPSGVIEVRRADSPNPAIQLSLHHPATSAPLIVIIQFNDMHDDQPSVRIECDHGLKPSDRFGTSVLATSGSIPITLQYILNKCSSQAMN